MSDAQFDEVVALALQLPPVEQARLMEQLAAAMHDVLASDVHEKDDTLWTDAEIAELANIEPMTGAEIIEAGLIGTWADLDIKNSAEWVNEQKRKRKEKRRW